MKQFFPTLLFFFLVGCSPKFMAGLYTTAKPEVMSFVNQELRLDNDGTFQYKFLSDDLNSNKKGQGKYELLNRKLILNFEKIDVAKSFAIKNNSSSKFNNIVRVLVEDMDHKSIIGATLILKDSGGKVLKNGISNEKGNCVLSWKKNEVPASLEISYTGFSNLATPLADESSLDYTIKLAQTFLTIPSGTVWEYELKVKKEKMRLTKDGRSIYFYKFSN